MNSLTERFPNVADVHFKVASTRSPIHERPPFQEFELDSIPEYVSCANPRCKKGRLWLTPVIALACAKHEQIFRQSKVCNGHEHGRGNKRSPCFFTFSIEGSVTYKD